MQEHNGEIPEQMFRSNRIKPISGGAKIHREERISF